MCRFTQFLTRIDPRSFSESVRQAYLQRVSLDSMRYKVINADLALLEVQVQIAKAIDELESA